MDPSRSANSLLGNSDYSHMNLEDIDPDNSSALETYYSSEGERDGELDTTPESMDSLNAQKGGDSEDDDFVLMEDNDLTTERQEQSVSGRSSSHYSRSSRSSRSQSTRSYYSGEDHSEGSSYYSRSSQSRSSYDSRSSRSRSSYTDSYDSRRASSFESSYTGSQSGVTTTTSTGTSQVSRGDWSLGAHDGGSRDGNATMVLLGDDDASHTSYDDSSSMMPPTSSRDWTSSNASEAPSFFAPSPFSPANSSRATSPAVPNLPGQPSSDAVSSDTDTTGGDEEDDRTEGGGDGFSRMESIVTTSTSAFTSSTSNPMTYSTTTREGEDSTTRGDEEEDTLPQVSSSETDGTPMAQLQRLEDEQEGLVIPPASPEPSGSSALSQQPETSQTFVPASALESEGFAFFSGEASPTSSRRGSRRSSRRSLRSVSDNEADDPTHPSTLPPSSEGDGGVDSSSSRRSSLRRQDSDNELRRRSSPLPRPDRARSPRPGTRQRYLGGGDGSQPAPRPRSSPSPSRIARRSPIPDNISLGASKRSLGSSRRSDSEDDSSPMPPPDDPFAIFGSSPHGSKRSLGSGAESEKEEDDLPEAPTASDVFATESFADIDPFHTTHTEDQVGIDDENDERQARADDLLHTEDEKGQEDGTTDYTDDAKPASPIDAFGADPFAGAADLFEDFDTEADDAEFFSQASVSRRSGEDFFGGSQSSRRLSGTGNLESFVQSTSPRKSRDTLSSMSSTIASSKQAPLADDYFDGIRPPPSFKSTDEESMGTSHESNERSGTDSSGRKGMEEASEEDLFANSSDHSDIKAFEESSQATKHSKSARSFQFGEQSEDFDSNNLSFPAGSDVFNQQSNKGLGEVDNSEIMRASPSKSRRDSNELVDFDSKNFTFPTGSGFFEESTNEAMGNVDSEAERGPATKKEKESMDLQDFDSKNFTFPTGSSFFEESQLSSPSKKGRPSIGEYLPRASDKARRQAGHSDDRTEAESSIGLVDIFGASRLGIQEGSIGLLDLFGTDAPLDPPASSEGGSQASGTITSSSKSLRRPLTKRSSKVSDDGLRSTIHTTSFDVFDIPEEVASSSSKRSHDKSPGSKLSSRRDSPNQTSVFGSTDTFGADAFGNIGSGIEPEGTFGASFFDDQAFNANFAPESQFAMEEKEGSHSPSGESQESKEDNLPRMDGDAEGASINVSSESPKRPLSWHAAQSSESPSSSPQSASVRSASLVIGSPTRSPNTTSSGTSSSKLSPNLPPTLEEEETPMEKYASSVNKLQLAEQSGHSSKSTRRGSRRNVLTEEVETTAKSPSHSSSDSSDSERNSQSSEGLTRDSFFDDEDAASGESYYEEEVVDDNTSANETYHSEEVRGHTASSSPHFAPGDTTSFLHDDESMDTERHDEEVVVDESSEESEAFEDNTSANETYYSEEQQHQEEGLQQDSFAVASSHPSSSHYSTSEEDVHSSHPSSSHYSTSEEDVHSSHPSSSQPSASESPHYSSQPSTSTPHSPSEADVYSDEGGSYSQSRASRQRDLSDTSYTSHSYKSESDQSSRSEFSRSVSSRGSESSRRSVSSRSKSSRQSHSFPHKEVSGDKEESHSQSKTSLRRDPSKFPSDESEHSSRSKSSRRSNQIPVITRSALVREADSQPSPFSKASSGRNSRAPSENLSSQSYQESLAELSRTSRSGSSESTSRSGRSQRRGRRSGSRRAQAIQSEHTHGTFEASWSSHPGSKGFSHTSPGTQSERSGRHRKQRSQRSERLGTVAEDSVVLEPDRPPHASPVASVGRSRRRRRSRSERSERLPVENSLSTFHASFSSRSYEDSSVDSRRPLATIDTSSSPNISSQYSGESSRSQPKPVSQTELLGFLNNLSQLDQHEIGRTSPSSKSRSRRSQEKGKLSERKIKSKKDRPKAPGAAASFEIPVPPVQDELLSMPEPASFDLPSQVTYDDAFPKPPVSPFGFPAPVVEPTSSPLASNLPLETKPPSPLTGQSLYAKAQRANFETVASVPLPSATSSSSPTVEFLQNRASQALQDMSVMTTANKNASDWLHNQYRGIEHTGYLQAVEMAYLFVLELRPRLRYLLSLSEWIHIHALLLYARIWTVELAASGVEAGPEFTIRIPATTRVLEPLAVVLESIGVVEDASRGVRYIPIAKPPPTHQDDDANVNTDHTYSPPDPEDVTVFMEWTQYPWQSSWIKAEQAREARWVMAQADGVRLPPRPPPRLDTHQLTNWQSIALETWLGWDSSLWSSYEQTVQMLQSKLAFSSYHDQVAASPFGTYAWLLPRRVVVTPAAKSSGNDEISFANETKEKEDPKTAIPKLDNATVVQCYLPYPQMPSHVYMLALLMNLCHASTTTNSTSSSASSSHDDARRPEGWYCETLPIKDLSNRLLVYVASSVLPSNKNSNKKN